MKKSFLNILGVSLSLLIAMPALAQTSFETGYQRAFSVRNVSQSNLDATTQVVNPGDILMYQIQLNGTQPVTDEVVRVRTGNMAGTMTLVDSTDGQIEGNYVRFPMVTDLKDSWTRTFSFYVRVEKNPTLKTVTMDFGDKSLTVNLSAANVMPPTPNNVKPTAVPTTGASYNHLYLLGFGVCLSSIYWYRRRS